MTRQSREEDLCDWSFMGKERGTEEGRGQIILRLVHLGFSLRKLGNLSRALSSQGTQCDLGFKSSLRLRYREGIIVGQGWKQV